MKRRRSSPRSSPLIGEDLPKQSNGATQSPISTKVQRASAEPGETHASNTTFLLTGALKCSLPPTCSGGRELLFNNVADMERHHATYHTHTCLDSGCGKVFPDARFLTLHQTECHDPLTDIRKERGEKTFECFLDTCPRKFMNPKARRLHLIQVHGYPAQFFFAITNKGVGGLLERWGEGVSLIRGKWKDRSNANTSDISLREHEEDMMSTDDEASSVRKTATSSPVKRSPASSSKPPRASRAPRISDTPTNCDPSLPSKPRAAADPSPLTTAKSTTPTLQPKPEASQARLAEDPLESLTSTMTALSLVPRTIHFGRTKTVGLGHR